MALIIKLFKIELIVNIRNGRPAKLEEHVESFLVEMLAAMSDIGYSLSQYEVCKYCIEDDDVLDEEFLCNRCD